MSILKHEMPLRVPEKYGPMSNVDEELKKDYEQILEDAHESNTDRPVPTRFPWHCKLAIRELLRLAIEKQQKSQALLSQQKRMHSTRSRFGNKNLVPVELRLFTGTLTELVYDIELQDLMLEFLDRGGMFYVIIWNQFDGIVPQNSFLARFLGNENVKVRFSQTTESHEHLQHFFLVGDYAFRLEEVHRPFAPEEFTDTFPAIQAKVIFNDPQQGKILKNLFDAVWNLLRGQAFNPNLQLAKSC